MDSPFNRYFLKMDSQKGVKSEESPPCSESVIFIDSYTTQTADTSVSDLSQLSP